MKGDVKYCAYHGEYLHVGESDGCPECEYYRYINDMDPEWVVEDDDYVDAL